jgi:hypothetical protein
VAFVGGRIVLVIAALFFAGCAGPGEEPRPSPGTDAVPSWSCLLDPCDSVVGIRGGAEPSVSIDSTDPRRAVLGAMVFDTSQNVRHPWFALATTRDGGATWERVKLPGGPNTPQSPFASYDFAADIVTAHTNDGNVLVLGLVGRGNPLTCLFDSRCVAPMPEAGFYGIVLDLALWRSTDEGRTFQEAGLVVRGSGADTQAWLPGQFKRNAAGEWIDKPNMVVDRATGRVHVAWHLRSDRDVASQLPAVRTAYSDDKGATWTSGASIPNAYGVSLAAFEGNVLLGGRFFGQGGARFSVAWSTDGGKTFGEAKIGSPSSTYDTIPVALWKDQGQVMAAAVVPSADQTGWALWRGASGTWSATNDSFQPGKAKFLAALELDAAGDGILATLAPIESSSDKLSLVLFDVVAGRLNGGPLRVANATTTMQGAFEYIGAAHGPDVAYLSWTPSDFMVPGIALRRGARAGVP